LKFGIREAVEGLKQSGRIEDGDEAVEGIDEIQGRADRQGVEDVRLRGHRRRVDRDAVLLAPCGSDLLPFLAIPSRGT